MLGRAAHPSSSHSRPPSLPYLKTSARSAACGGAGAGKATVRRLSSQYFLSYLRAARRGHGGFLSKDAERSRRRSASASLTAAAFTATNKNRAVTAVVSSPSFFFFLFFYVTPTHSLPSTSRSPLLKGCRRLSTN